MNYRVLTMGLLLVGASLGGAAVLADEGDARRDESVYPVAILPFQDRGREVEGLGSQASDLLFAELVANPRLYLVEREDIGKLFSEQELNLSGLVNPAQATQIGQLTGAKIVVTGSVLQVGNHLYVVAKIMGTETTRVLGASVKGADNEDLDKLVAGLAKDVSKTITQRATELVAPAIKTSDRLAALKKEMPKGKRPTVFIDITERHIGQVAVDPAAQTELALYCEELGFQVIDSEAGSKGDADVLISGQGFSQFAARHGNLTSVKARLEVKALQPKTGRVLAVDRQTSVAVGLAEQIAAKSALQQAAADIAARMLPSIANPKD